MVSTDTDIEDPALTEEETEFDRLVGVIADGVVGAVGGLAGTATMTVVLLAAEQLGAFSRGSFADLTTLVGMEGYVPPVTFGFLLFLVGGMVPWPLVFASLEAYLPGESWPVGGVFFGTALWVGFVGAFWSGETGLLLVLYLTFTLVAHWVYGFTLGLVFQYLSDRPDTLI